MALLPVEQVVVRADLTEVSLVLGRQAEVLLSQLGHDSLLLHLEVFVAELLNLLAHAHQEFVDAIDDILATTLGRLNHELGTEHLTSVDSAREHDIA